MAEDFLKQWEFDGYELYPLGNCDYDIIPKNLIKGLHMRFFPILSPIWENDEKRLIEIFGNWESVEYYYGGSDSTWITEFYSSQLDLAENLGCTYVIFHPVQCEPEYIYSWNFPWSVKDTLDLFSKVVNSVIRNTSFSGSILFENLWWPGSFCLNSPWEYDYLLSKVDYPNCGITLDTGHMMIKNPYLKKESEAIEYINKCINDLGEIAKCIKNVHLTKSLSGEYILKSKKNKKTINASLGIKEKLNEIYNHIRLIDLHEPFEEKAISSIFDKIEPDSTVFEFTYRDIDHWKEKISIQKEALLGSK
jgi:sugar phosphate isomerase/epimerase